MKTVRIVVLAPPRDFVIEYRRRAGSNPAAFVKHAAWLKCVRDVRRLFRRRPEFLDPIVK
jgi:hypothetical protein